MPEFEENKSTPNLDKDTLQYQPSEGTSDKQTSPSRTTPSSNMRGRWKRPSSHGSSKPIAAEKEEQEELLHSTINDEYPEDEEEEYLSEEEEEEERAPYQETYREERTPRPHHKKQATVTKPVSRKDVFIPKTKQESERHKTRYPAMGQKQPSLWRKILAFFGLVSSPKKHSRKQSDKNERPHNGSYQKKRYSQPRKHPTQRNHSAKNPGKSGPKSSF